MVNIPRSDIHELTGKRRQRDIYWRPIIRPDGTVVWVQTSLLPSDALGKEYYLTKGFRLEPPEEIETSIKVPIEIEVAAPNENLQPCPHCSFVAKSRFGLRAHIRTKHKKIE